MTTISISEELKGKVPGIKLSCIECDVYVMETNDMLWDEIKNKTEELSAALKISHLLLQHRVQPTKPAGRIRHAIVFRLNRFCEGWLKTRDFTR
jgi:hypothetical protein